MVDDGTSPTRAELGMLALGRRLRALREGAGQTLAVTAAGAGLSVSYLSDVERGRRLPALDALARICSALDVLVVDALHDVYPYGTRVPGPAVGPPPDGRTARRRTP